LLTLQNIERDGNESIEGIRTIKRKNRMRTEKIKITCIKGGPRE
jgi:hypothetical protein